MLLALALLSGCAASADDASPPAGAHRPDDDLRGTIHRALLRAGRTAEAGVVLRGGCRLTAVSAPFLDRWQIVRVDYRQQARPVLFHVAVGGSRALLLTGAPAGFGTVTRADGVRVADADAAVRLARTYFETTRPASPPTYLVSGVLEIRFRPGLTGADAARRDGMVRRFRSVVTAPGARPAAGGFTAVLYAVQGAALQRREIAVGADGSVRERMETLTADMPVPYVL